MARSSFAVPWTKAFFRDRPSSLHFSTIGKCLSHPCATALSRAKHQQLTRNPAVEQVHLALRLQPHRMGQGAVAGENAGRPTRAAAAEDLAQRSVERDQLALLAQALTVGRVAQEDAGRPV